jgi:bifunctional ADP-heptose synthase (sugar kinase/adenylyltransferase)
MKDNNFIKNKIGNKIKFHSFNKENSPTIVKRRYIEENERRKLLGVYTFNDAEINESSEKKIINFLDKKLNKYDCIIVADYGHGLINSKIAQKIIKKSKFCSLNAQINAANIGHHSLEKYKNLDCVIINLNELKHEMRSRSKNFAPIGKKLIKKMNIDNLIVTMGRAGAALLNKTKPSYSVAPSFARDIVDKVGAGDCLFALLSLFLSSKINSEVSLFLASIAAGKNVEIVGNSNYLDRVEFLKTVDHILK